MLTGLEVSMSHILVPKVTFSQGLTVPPRNGTLGSMDADYEKAAFAARLNEICDDMKVPPKGQARQTTLAIIFGITQKGVRKWLEGEGYPSIDMARRIAMWADVHFEWLMTGRGPKWISEAPGEGMQNGQDRAKSTYLVQNVSPAPDIKGRIPLISYVQAGAWDEAVDIYEPGYAERWLPFLKNNGEKTFALRVEGDSMTAPYGKSYPAGCIVFVDPERRAPISGERIIAKLEGSNQVTFKVFVEDAGHRWLKPLNPQHPPVMEPFRVVGTVIGKWEDD